MAYRYFLILDRSETYAFEGSNDGGVVTLQIADPSNQKQMWSISTPIPAENSKIINRTTGLIMYLDEKGRGTRVGWAIACVNQSPDQLNGWRLEICGFTDGKNPIVQIIWPTDLNVSLPEKTEAGQLPVIAAPSLQQSTTFVIVPIGL